MTKCPKCGGERICRNGHRNGRQCHLCRECGYQFTNPDFRERPMWEKMLASLVHALGVSPSDIAQLFGTSTSSVMRWRVLGRTRSEERTTMREKSVLLGVSRLRELIDSAPGLDGARGPDTGRKPLVLIVDEKNADKVVGDIIQE
ncbi:MAG: hypothetical protein Q4F72_13045 [Desulfovibrionaceae bacterium]|nr:hypothetical protein [Desulfovibrionaceae bacterium]